MFRFTIRDVLWLMVVVGLACAWLLTLHLESLRYARLAEETERVRQRTLKQEFDAKLTIGVLEGQIESEKQKRIDAEEHFKTKIDWRFPVYYRD
jgi:hypothetical protein